MAKIDQKFHKNSKSKYDDEREEYQDVTASHERKRSKRLARQRYHDDDYPEVASWSE